MLPKVGSYFQLFSWQQLQRKYHLKFLGKITYADSLVWHGDTKIAIANTNNANEQNMFDISVLTSWSGSTNVPTVTVTFVNPIVFHKLVIVKTIGGNKAGLSHFPK